MQSNERLSADAALRLSLQIFTVDEALHDRLRMEHSPRVANLHHQCGGAIQSKNDYRERDRWDPVLMDGKEAFRFLWGMVVVVLVVTGLLLWHWYVT